jgi:putative flavoprotein involved in K+ transport
VTTVDGNTVRLARDLAALVAHADLKMQEQLDRIDRFIETNRAESSFPEEARPGKINVASAPDVLRLDAEGIRTVVWATGYRREYPWLHVDVLDARGELIHDGGITREPGLYALGLYFMRRRNSNFLDGVGADATELAAHIDAYLSRRALTAA